jgi:hypothetical protein
MDTKPTENWGDMNAIMWTHISAAPNARVIGPVWERIAALVWAAITEGERHA